MRKKLNYNESITRESDKKRIRTYFKELQNQGFTIPESEIQKITATTRKEIRDQFLKSDETKFIMEFSFDKKKNYIPISNEQADEYLRLKNRWQKGRTNMILKATTDDEGESIGTMLPSYSTIGLPTQSPLQTAYRIAQQTGDTRRMKEIENAQREKVEKVLEKMREGPKKALDTIFRNDTDNMGKALSQVLSASSPSGADLAQFIIDKLKAGGYRKYKKGGEVLRRLYDAAFKYKESMLKEIMEALAFFGIKTDKQMKSIIIGGRTLYDIIQDFQRLDDSR